MRQLPAAPVPAAACPAVAAVLSAELTVAESAAESAIAPTYPPVAEDSREVRASAARSGDCVRQARDSQSTVREEFANHSARAESKFLHGTGLRRSCTLWPLAPTCLCSLPTKPLPERIASRNAALPSTDIGGFLSSPA